MTTETMTSTRTSTNTLATLFMFPGTYGTIFDSDSICTEELTSEQVENFWDNFDFEEWLETLADYFVTSVNDVLITHTKLNCEQTYHDVLELESVRSPRAYNFSNDRIFVNLDEEFLSYLSSQWLAANHDKLAEVIRAQYTPRSGFIPHYSNELKEWLAKPVADYDHNELGTLLLAYLLTVQTSEEWHNEIYESICSNTDLYYA